MSNTYKDTARNTRRDIEVVLVKEGFDVFVRGELRHSCISERTLVDVLCVGWGYCGPEFDEILREVRSNGRKTILL